MIWCADLLTSTASSFVCFWNISNTIIVYEKCYSIETYIKLYGETRSNVSIKHFYQIQLKSYYIFWQHRRRPFNPSSCTPNNPVPPLFSGYPLLKLIERYLEFCKFCLMFKTKTVLRDKVTNKTWQTEGSFLRWTLLQFVHEQFELLLKFDFILPELFSYLM